MSRNHAVHNMDLDGLIFTTDDEEEETVIAEVLFEEEDIKSSAT